MKIRSIHVGVARHVVWNGKRLETAIFKAAIDSPVAITAAGLEGDTRSGVVHQTEYSAVYAFPHEQYAHWRTALGRPIEAGSFGENFVATNLDDVEARVGDLLEFEGGLVLEVTGPRMPCSKLAMRFDDREMPKRFTEHGRTGIYFRVNQPGSVRAGDTGTWRRSPAPSFPVYDLIALAQNTQSDAQLQAMLAVANLAPVWRELLQKRARGDGTES